MYYKLAQLTLGVMLKIVFRPWAEGARNVPRQGPAIIASNHLSFSDHFFGPLPLRRQVIPRAAEGVVSAEEQLDSLARGAPAAPQGILRPPFARSRNTLPLGSAIPVCPWSVK